MHKVSVETVVVDGNERGAVLRVLYIMARECEGVTACDFGDRDRDDLWFEWEWWARMAIFPIFLQGMLLWLLVEIVWDQDGDSDEEDKPAWQFVITSLIVFAFDVFTFLTGPSLRCLYACCRINFDSHEIYPRFTKIVAWFLYLSDLSIGLVTFGLGVKFLINSESKDDLLLNVVALHFILDIDDYITALTPNIGVLADMAVPKVFIYVLS